MFHLVVPGPPVAKARARIVYRERLGKYVGVTPEKTQAAEEEIGWLARCESGRDMMEGALRLTVRFYYPIPRSWPKWRQKEAAADSPKQRPTVKPDLDNLLKLVKDALTGIAWHDDAQIVDLTAHKYYSLEPRTDIVVDRS